eukprot:contig_25635_g6319
MQPSARLGRHTTMAVARGVATVKPDEPFSVTTLPNGSVQTGDHYRSDQQNVKLKIIKQSHRDWASLVVIVPKENAKARFCVDYRRLNNITEMDAYPLPRMEDCVAKTTSTQGTQ